MLWEGFHDMSVFDVRYLGNIGMYETLMAYYWLEKGERSNLMNKNQQFVLVEGNEIEPFLREEDDEEFFCPENFVRTYTFCLRENHYNCLLYTNN